jgi:hypothetical protein
MVTTPTTLVLLDSKKSLSVFLSANLLMLQIGFFFYATFSLLLDALLYGIIIDKWQALNNSKN